MRADVCRARPSTNGTSFSTVSVPGQKRVRILLLEKPAFWAFRYLTRPWPQLILFGQAEIIILRGFGCGELELRAAADFALTTRNASRISACNCSQEDTQFEIFLFRTHEEVAGFARTNDRVVRSVDTLLAERNRCFA